MIYALIVIYNKSCEDSNSIKDIRKFSPDIPLIVFDNSETDFENESFCRNNGYIYYSKKKNIGISKAYNYVIKNTNFDDGDYLIMLDDDTHLTLEYIRELKAKVKENSYDVILPIVYAKDKIISPYNYHMNCRSKMVKAPDELIMSKVSGINSGMIIKTNVFKKVRYNEELFLDYVDYDFMRRIHSIAGEIAIMKSRINQEFQYFEYDNSKIQGALKRFEIDMHDYRILCEETGEKWFFYVHAIKFMIKQTINYHSFKFFILFIKNL